MLFADLAGSTALGGQLDPEEVRELQGELFRVLHTEVERFGGTTQKFIGHAILAVFGIPQTHEDDPERAIRAALAAHEEFTAFADRVRANYCAEVGLRIGVNTGEVVAGRAAAARGELMVSGDAVNIAARLQQNAKPGEVLVGVRTHAATKRTVSYGPRRDIGVKGKKTHVRADLPSRSRSSPTPPPADLACPFIGRHQEIAVLQAVAARVERENVPQLVTLFGQAGVGKSRLLTELLCGSRTPGSCAGGACRTGRAHVLVARGGRQDRCGDPRHGPRLHRAGEAPDAVVSVVEEGYSDVFEAIAWTMGFSVPGSAIITADPSASGPWRTHGSVTARHWVAGNSPCSSSRTCTGRRRLCSNCSSRSRTRSQQRVS